MLLNSLPPHIPFNDFSALLEGVDKTGKQVKIWVHSPTDDEPNIHLLEENIKRFNPDIVISSIRDIDWQRSRVLMLVGSNYSFEVPLARITRRHHHRSLALLWYQNSIDSVIDTVIGLPPFNI